MKATQGGPNKNWNLTSETFLRSRLLVTLVQGHWGLDPEDTEGAFPVCDINTCETLARLLLSLTKMYNMNCLCHDCKVHYTHHCYNAYEGNLTNNSVQRHRQWQIPNTLVSRNENRCGYTRNRSSCLSLQPRCVLRAILLVCICHVVHWALQSSCRHHEILCCSGSLQS